MRHLLAGLLCIPMLVGCNLTPGGLEPIPGSITYHGQPRTKLTKAPVGSIVSHYFIAEDGRSVYENYIIQPDRSLYLASRRWRPWFQLHER